MTQTSFDIVMLGCRCWEAVTKNRLVWVAEKKTKQTKHSIFTEDNESPNLMKALKTKPFLTWGVESKLRRTQSFGR